MPASTATPSPARVLRRGSCCHTPELPFHYLPRSHRGEPVSTVPIPETRTPFRCLPGPRAAPRACVLMCEGLADPVAVFFPGGLRGSGGASNRCL